MSVKIHFKVKCSDGPAGEVSRVIADPITRNIRFLVVEGGGREVVVPFEQATLEGQQVVLGFSSADLARFPSLDRENFVALNEVEIAGLERRMEEVAAGEILVPLPELEKDMSRRSFFIKFTNAIGVVLTLPLVYPIIRYLIQPMYQPFDNTWFKMANSNMFQQVDSPRLVKFPREIKEGYIVRTFNKSHWVVRASEALREQTYELRKKLFSSNPLEFKDSKGNVVWENDPNSEFLVFSGKCPHLGCAYRWKENHKKYGKVYWCPCHLSIYGPEGSVLDGPAPRPLDLMPTKVTAAGSVEVIDAEFKAGRKDVVRIL